MHLPRGKKLKLVKRLGKGVSASQICRQAGICRASLYRWKNHYENSPSVNKLSVLSSQYVRGQKHWKKLSVKKEQQIRKIALRNPALSVAKIAVLAGVSLSGAWSVLKNKDLHKREGRERYQRRYGERLIVPLTPDQRVEMFRRFDAGESVRDLCKQFDISRTTFYKWINLYRKGKNTDKSLIDRRPAGKIHYKYVPGAEQLVLALVAHDPGLSPIQISKILKEYAQQHLVSQFGVYTILKRYGLNTYQQRFEYANRTIASELIPVVTQQWKLPAILRNIFTSFIPPPSRSYLISRFLFLVVLFSISFFFAFLSIASVQRTLQTLPLANIVGLSFALMSLLFGTIFFLYSLKYYLTIGIVLSFSRKSHLTSDGVSQHKSFL
ncbi:MAG: helix-turn-helix domain-containing protein, partial [Candidatus Levybacteria bacterium]|nr:helix-turn-helix domain-containing protein [Candidatus Levybacteria bacterium]